MYDLPTHYQIVEVRNFIHLFENVRNFVRKFVRNCPKSIIISFENFGPKIKCPKIKHPKILEINVLDLEVIHPGTGHLTSVVKWEQEYPWWQVAGRNTIQPDEKISSFLFGN